MTQPYAYTYPGFRYRHLEIGTPFRRGGRFDSVIRTSSFTQMG